MSGPHSVHAMTFGGPGEAASDMARICTACGREVAEAAYCPYCSQPTFDRPGIGHSFSEPPPHLIRIAGLIWVLCGGVWLFCWTIIGLWAVLSTGSRSMIFLAIQGPLVLSYGAIFILVGMRTMRGTAAVTLGHGIVTIGLGILFSNSGILIIVTSGKLRTLLEIGDLIGISICLLIGAGLLTAGALALAGRGQYRAWRRAVQSSLEAREKWTMPSESDRDAIAKHEKGDGQPPPADSSVNPGSIVVKGQFRNRP